MLQLQFSIEGEQQMSRRLRLLGNTISDWSPSFEKTAKYMKDVFSNDVFSSEGGVIDEPWKALAPNTLKQKRLKGYGSQKLVNTGAMKNSFKTQFSASDASIWNTAEYFKYHQSNKPRHKIPRRVMMKLAEAQRRTIVRIFQKQFRDKINAI